MNIISLQFSLFYLSPLERPDLVFGDLNKNMLNFFDAMPMQIPLPPGLPLDIPILTLRTISNDYSCNISKSRIDLLFQAIKKEDDNKFLEDFNTKTSIFVSAVFKSTEIVRFGMVCRYFDENEKASQVIKEKYIKPNELDGNIDELSLRFNRKSTFEEFEINDLVEIVDSRIILDGVEKKGILIQRDINNTPITERKLDEIILKKISSVYSDKITPNGIRGLLG